MKTGGEWFVRCLNSLGVEFVFGTTGAGMPDIQDAMVVNKPPKWIQGLHEFVSLNAAAGYALATEGHGIVLIDRLVGTQNAIGGFYCAFMNSAPVVVFASENVPGVSITTGELEYHYLSDLVTMPGKWVKWSTRLESLETLPMIISKALLTARSPHEGPVYVNLRQDLMASTLKKAELPSSDLCLPARRIPDDETLLKILVLLEESQFPLLITGQSGRHPDSVPELMEFAHRVGVGVYDRRVFLNYPMTDKMHLGFAPPLALPELDKACDTMVLLEFGLLPDLRFGENVKVVELYSDPRRLQDVNGGGDYGGSVLPAYIRAECDATDTLTRLVQLAERRSKTGDKSHLAERRAIIQSKHEKTFNDWKVAARKSYDSERLDAYSAGFVLNANWTSDTVWVNGTISPRPALIRTVVLDTPGSYFSNPSGHLGAVTGMSYGVALSRKRYSPVKHSSGAVGGRITGENRPVVCTTGDGDAIFGNLDSALWTVSHYGIGVFYIIMNNACWGIEWPPIARSSQHWASKTGDFEFLDLDRPRIDFSKLAEAFGVRSWRVSRLVDFERACVEGLKIVRSGRPALIDLELEKYTGPQPSSVL